MSEPNPGERERLERLSPSEARQLCRRCEWSAPTAGLARGHVQANLILLPTSLADAFDDFCRANPQPCPLLERLAAGDPEPRHLAPGADLRTDLPRYLVSREDGSLEEALEIRELWKGDSVAFLLGCSFSFDEALAEAGLIPRHVEEGVNVPMYRTRRGTRCVGPFGGPLVVSMRPVPRQRLQEAYELTRPYTFAHGAPIHHGDPASLGINDLRAPDWGDPVTVNDEEVPVFWACGVTSQTAAQRALAHGLCERVIAHAPGHMFVCDARSRELREEGPRPHHRG